MIENMAKKTVKPKKAEPLSKTMILRLEQSLYDELTAEAQADERSTQGYMRLLLKSHPLRKKQK